MTFSLSPPPFGDLSVLMRHLSPPKAGGGGKSGSFRQQRSREPAPVASTTAARPGAAGTRRRGFCADEKAPDRQPKGRPPARVSPAQLNGDARVLGGGGGNRTGFCPRSLADPNAARRFSQLVESADLRQAGKGVWRSEPRRQRGSFILLLCFEQQVCVGGRGRRYVAFLDSEKEDNRLVLRRKHSPPLSSSPCWSGKHGAERRAGIIDGEERRQLEGQRGVSEASPRGGERKLQERAVTVYTPRELVGSEPPAAARKRASERASATKEERKRVTSPALTFPERPPRPGLRSSGATPGTPGATAWTKGRRLSLEGCTCRRRR